MGVAIAILCVAIWGARSAPNNHFMSLISDRIIYDDTSPAKRL